MTTRLVKVRWIGFAAAAALATACALNDPPTDDTPSHGGLPEGVSASPATPQVGPVTNPTPPGAAEPALMPTRQPLGNFASEKTRPVALDSATKLLSARLDTVIMYGNRDLTQMPIPRARSIVQSISRQLHVSKVTRVHNVAVELDSLDVLLAQNPIDGRAVGRSLQRLSGRAAAASPEAGVLAGRVAHLADVLQSAGNKLANGH